MDALEQGWELLLASRWSEAITAFDRALSGPSTDPVRALIGRANALRFLGRTDEAVKDLTRAIANDPRRADAYHERGVALVILGRHGEALNDFDRAIALEPSAIRLTDRGATLLQLGQYVDATLDLRRAVDLQPELAEAHYNLGSAQARSGDLRGAAASFRQAQRLGLSRAEDKLLRARQELFVTATEDGSASLAVEALVDARSAVDVGDALDRFPFMALADFIESLEGGLSALPPADAAALRQRIDALKGLAD